MSSKFKLYGILWLTNNYLTNQGAAPISKCYTKIKLIIIIQLKYNGIHTKSRNLQKLVNKNHN